MAHRKNKFLFKAGVNFLAILLTSYLLRDIVIAGPVAALVAALLLGIINAVIRPFFVLLSLPLTVLTLGLFTFVINALMLKLTAALLPGFAIYGFWTAILGAILISIFSSLISSLID